MRARLIVVPLVPNRCARAFPSMPSRPGADRPAHPGRSVPVTAWPGWRRAGLDRISPGGFSSGDLGVEAEYGPVHPPAPDQVHGPDESELGLAGRRVACRVPGNEPYPADLAKRCVSSAGETCVPARLADAAGDRASAMSRSRAHTAASAYLVARSFGGM